MKETNGGKKKVNRTNQEIFISETSKIKMHVFAVFQGKKILFGLTRSYIPSSSAAHMFTNIEQQNTALMIGVGTITAMFNMEAQPFTTSYTNSIVNCKKHVKCTMTSLEFAIR